ncbi:MAG: DUF951 domain-containing protein [Chloroflexota bacterium]|nr:DUF951 domain-containing protein [Chloroflexota bacterium]
MTEGPLLVCLEDVVRLRKPHPCGSFEWTVVRLGADIGLRCHGCDHRVLLSRRTLTKRLKAFVRRGPDCDSATAASERDLAPDASQATSRAST